ncbi:MAG: cation:proton antiporter [Kiritimatiellae bacterium]|nr:cation:proton antiporter [Kiritimatiellia bacterium]
MKKWIYRFVFGLCFIAVPAMAGTAGEGHGVDGDMGYRMMMLMIQLGVIILAAKLGNILFERLKLPGVLGELSAGILIGPYLLGSISLPGFDAGLFPVVNNFAVSPELYGVCSIAAVVLLFMVGLETDISLLMRYSVSGGLVGVGGVVASFVVGDLIAVMLSQSIFGEQLSFMSPACMLMGIIATATSVGITARILSEKRKLDSPEGVTILAGAVIDDVLGIVLLAVGLGVVSASVGEGGVDWGHIGIIAMKALGIWLAATAAGLLASRKISFLLKWFDDKSSIAMMALGLALILAGLFEEAGLAMIIGAYVMGLSLSNTDIDYVVREKLAPIYAFMVPVFFTVMGMLVDVKLMMSGKVLLFGLVYAAGVGFAKVAGCGIPSLFCGFNLRGALRIGCGMLPRGEVTLIIAGVGLAAGILPPEGFGAVVFMLLITTVIAGGLLSALFGSYESGLRGGASAQKKDLLSFTFPSEESAALLVGKLLQTFEDEGFFVHVLDRKKQIHQLRKDDVIVGFEHKGCEIVFDCRQRDVTFINTAMYEVLAELEHAVKELRKPIDRKAIGRKLQEGAEEGVVAATITNHTSRKALIPDMKGDDKFKIIDELLSSLVASGDVLDLELARKAVLVREESMSTGMQYGMAIPHGRTDAVKRLVCAVGIKHDGVDFDSLDGLPARIIVLTLSPKSVAAPHMQFMSMISNILNEEGRATLLACRTPVEMHLVLSGKKELVRSMERKSFRNFFGKKNKNQSPLGKYLKKELLITDLAGRSKTEVIDELLALLDKNNIVADIAAVRQDVLAREAEMSTAVGHGVAIPHARTDHVDDLVCVVGVHAEGVDFHGPKSEKTHIIVLTLSPKQVSVPHVQLMAMISRSLNEDGRRKVLAAKTADELLQALLG